MEVLLEFLVFLQHEQCHISVQLADAVPTPVLRHGDLDDGVLLVQLNVAEDMVAV